MPAQQELTQVERDKLEIDPDIDFRAVAARPFSELTPNELGMFKWSGVYHQLQRGYFMIRVSVPGGTMTAKQLRRIGKLAATYARDQLCITTRQTLQFHWIRQQDIYKIIEGVAEVGLTTRNACGDVCRNVVSCSLQGVCQHEVGDTRPVLDSIAHDPVIQEQKRNLPRKHKIADIGLRGRRQRRERGSVEAFAVFVGGRLRAKGLPLVDRQHPLPEGLPRENGHSGIPGRNLRREP